VLAWEKKKRGLGSVGGGKESSLSQQDRCPKMGNYFVIRRQGGGEKIEEKNGFTCECSGGRENCIIEAKTGDQSGRGSSIEKEGSCHFFSSKRLSPL